MTPALARRQNQAVPATPEAAAARFKCEAYLCTMEGTKCRDQHVHAAEFKPMNRDACIDCPAGQARAKLLGRGAAAAASSCTARTAAGHPCANPAVDGGLCHTHRGAAAAGKTRTATAKTTAKKEPQMAKKPAPAKKKPEPVKKPEVKAAPVAAPKPEPAAPTTTGPSASVAAATPETPVAGHNPATVEPVATAAAPTCKRQGCERPAVAKGRLADYCRWCHNSAYMTTKKGLGRTPSDDERIAWLERTPVHKHFRHPVEERPVTPPTTPVSPGLGRKAPPGSKGIDWSVQPLGQMSDTELGVRLGCSATAVRTQRKKRGIASLTPPPASTMKRLRRLPRHKARLEIGERLCKLLDVKTPPAFDLFPVGESAWGCKIDPADPVSLLHPEGDFQFNTTCWRPDTGPRGEAKPEAVAPVVEVVTEPVRIVGSLTINQQVEEPATGDPPAAPVGRSGVGMGACPTAISELPDHLVVITIPLNRRAYAELERMAATGLHGDDPCDAARTLILDGLRRHALVRL